MESAEPAISAAEIAEAVRFKLDARGVFGRCNDLTDEQLARLVTRTLSIEVALDALAMRPWPSWLIGVLYPGRTSRP